MRFILQHYKTDCLFLFHVPKEYKILIVLEIGLLLEFVSKTALKVKN